MEYYRKNILISGGSSGIGFALAKKFAKLGANVTILARREELLNAALRKISVYKVDSDHIIKIIQADVTKYYNLRRILAKEKTKYDILINSAGLAYPGKFLDLDIKVFRDLIDTNYLGTVNLTKIIVPHMIEKKSGYIVNVSSAAVLVGLFGYTAYAPSKYAVYGFSRCLRTELESYGIYVSVVLPQDTDTPQLTFERNLLPEITKKINERIEKIFGSASTISADKAADFIVAGMNKFKFRILFGFEGKFGALISPILDRFFYRYAVRLSKKESLDLDE